MKILDLLDLLDSFLDKLSERKAKEQLGLFIVFIAIVCFSAFYIYPWSEALFKSSYSLTLSDGREPSDNLKYLQNAYFTGKMFLVSIALIGFNCIVGKELYRFSCRNDEMTILQVGRMVDMSKHLFDYRSSPLIVDEPLYDEARLFFINKIGEDLSKMDNLTIFEFIVFEDELSKLLSKAKKNIRLKEKEDLPNQIAIHKDNAKARIKEAINSKVQNDKDN